MDVNYNVNFNTFSEDMLTGDSGNELVTKGDVVEMTMYVGVYLVYCQHLPAERNENVKIKTENPILVLHIHCAAKDGGKHVPTFTCHIHNDAHG